MFRLVAHGKSILQPHQLSDHLDGATNEYGGAVSGGPLAWVFQCTQVGIVCHSPSSFFHPDVKLDLMWIAERHGSFSHTVWSQPFDDPVI
jgi:hypothetical protein